MKLRLLTLAARLAGSKQTAPCAVASSGLAWGGLLRDGAPHPPPPIPPAIVEQAFRTAENALTQDFAPTKRLRLEGTLNRDPAHQEAGRVKSEFPKFLALALAARLGPQALRAPACDKAKRIFLAWAASYRPTGNPIDERFFLPLFLAIDLSLKLQPYAAQAALRGWMQAFVTAGDGFYARRPPDDLARRNNWMSARLLVRAVAGGVAGDLRAAARTRDLLNGFSQVNFEPDTEGRMDGRTFDFRQRDALTYHVTDLEFLLLTLLLAPSVVERPVQDHIRRGLLFLKPYYLGEKTHIEFLHTSVAFDLKRRDHDPSNVDFQNRPWRPARARNLLRLGRLAFPAIESWTGPVRGDAQTELLAALLAPPPPAPTI